MLVRSPGEDVLFDLVAIAYADEHRAAEVFATLQRLRYSLFHEITDVVCVVRRTDWTVLLQRQATVLNERESAEDYWRGLLATLILAPGAGRLRKDAGEYGIGHAFRQWLEAELPPGGSAVLLILPAHASASVQSSLSAFGGSRCATPLTWSDGTPPIDPNTQASALRITRTRLSQPGPAHACIRRLHGPLLALAYEARRLEVLSWQQPGGGMRLNLHSAVRAIRSGLRELSDKLEELDGLLHETPDSAPNKAPSTGTPGTSGSKRYESRLLALQATRGPGHAFWG